MKRTLFLISFLLTISGAYSQSELEKRNGFKDIKLATPVDSIKGIKFKKDFKEADEFEARLYEVEHEAYTSIGEVSIKKLELKSYKGLIYEITVVTPKDQRLMKALESIYGKSEYDIKAETYFWKAPDIVLSFRAHSKHQLEMVYTSLSVKAMMKADKAKKVEAIADDF